MSSIVANIGPSAVTPFKRREALASNDTNVARPTENCGKGALMFCLFWVGVFALVGWALSYCNPFIESAWSGIFG